MLNNDLKKSTVKLWEDTIRIPSYPVGTPELNPVFYTGRAYQGAQGHVYPYSLMEKLSDTCENKAYKGVFLENKYVKICVLPERNKDNRRTLPDRPTVGTTSQSRIGTLSVL